MSQTQDQPPSRVCLGKISGVHGIKGLVKILPFGDDINLLNGMLYTASSGADTISISIKNMQGKHVLAALEGVNDRSQAETYKDTELWIDRDALPDPGDDEYYIEDLIGMTAKDENGETVGKVVSVQNFGAGDLLEIQPANGESFFVPFTNKLITKIDDGAITLAQHYHELLTK